MLLSLLYLSVNLGCLAVLVSGKYYRMWRFLVAQIAVTCWQVGVLLFVPVSDRAMAIRWWLPGDIVLVGLSALAVLEVLWRSMRGFPDRYRYGVCLSLTAGFVFAGMSIRWLLDLPTYGDWFAQLRADRSVWNLCIAGAALIAVGVANTFNRGNDPRFVRFHGVLVAVLAAGHVLLADMTHWSQSRMLYRSLEAACCFGWMINANLLGQEAQWAGRLAAHARNFAVEPAPCPPVLRASPPPERGGFGRRRWVGRHAVEMRSAPSEMR